MPDVIHVDQTPLGLSGELAPFLDLRRRLLPRTRMIVSIDDSGESPEAYRDQLAGGRSARTTTDC